MLFMSVAPPECRGHNAFKRDGIHIRECIMDTVFSICFHKKKRKPFFGTGLMSMRNTTFSITPSTAYTSCMTQARRPRI